MNKIINSYFEKKISLLEIYETYSKELVTHKKDYKLFKSLHLTLWDKFHVIHNENEKQYSVSIITFLLCIFSYKLKSPPTTSLPISYFNNILVLNKHWIINENHLIHCCSLRAILDLLTACEWEYLSKMGDEPNSNFNKKLETKLKFKHLIMERIYYFIRKSSFDSNEILNVEKYVKIKNLSNDNMLHELNQDKNYIGSNINDNEDDVEHNNTKEQKKIIGKKRLLDFLASDKKLSGNNDDVVLQYAVNEKFIVFTNAILTCLDIYEFESKLYKMRSINPINVFHKELFDTSKEFSRCIVNECLKMLHVQTNPSMIILYTNTFIDNILFVTSYGWEYSTLFEHGFDRIPAMTNCLQHRYLDYEKKFHVSSFDQIIKAKTNKSFYRDAVFLFLQSNLYFSFLTQWIDFNQTHEIGKLMDDINNTTTQKLKFKRIRVLEKWVLHCPNNKIYMLSSLTEGFVILRYLVHKKEVILNEDDSKYIKCLDHHMGSLLQ